SARHARPGRPPPRIRRVTRGSNRSSAPPQRAPSRPERRGARMGAAGSSAAGGEGHDMKRRTKVAVGAAVVLVVVLAAGGFAFWQLFGGSDPSPVALNPVTSSPASTTAASSGGSLDGTWTIDDTSGSLAEGTSSFAGYRVKEELVGTGANTAVGRTQNVSGSLTIDGTAITAMQVSVDMATLQSDDSRRDERLGTDGLQTDRFPTATFTLTKPIEVGSVPKDGPTHPHLAARELTL